MAKKIIPKNIEEITPEWLSQALTESGVLNGNSVSSVKSDTIGEQGYMGILARLHLEYEQPDDSLPATMIAKMPTEEAKNKITGELFLNFERENRLYEDYLDKLPVRTPRCYFSNMDPGFSERTINFSYLVWDKMPKWVINIQLGISAIWVLLKKRRYILLLEDFAELDYCDQRDGCSFDDAKLVMKSLGQSQATYWENSAIDQYWLKAHAEIGSLMGLLYERGLPVIERNFEEKLSPKDKEVFKWLVDNNDQMDNYILTRPTTLVHSDFRIDNIFFDREKNEVAVIDWQTAYQGLGIADLGYFTLGSGSEPFTPEQVEELVTIYHQGLLDGGVQDYSLSDCQLDYKYGFFVGLRYILIILGALEIDNDPDIKNLVGLWIDRMKPLIEDFDLTQMVPGD